MFKEPNLNYVVGHNRVTYPQMLKLRNGVGFELKDMCKFLQIEGFVVSVDFIHDKSFLSVWIKNYDDIERMKLLISKLEYVSS